MNKTIPTIIASLALVFTLTACGNTETPAPAETTTPPAPVQTVTPEPTQTEVPEAEEFEGEVVERNANGDIIAPDGSTIECPAESTGAFIAEDGTVSCDTGVDW